MEEYNNDKNLKATCCMNKTTLSKLTIMLTLFKLKCDYGSGISPEFIKSVQQTGANTSMIFRPAKFFKRMNCKFKNSR